MCVWCKRPSRPESGVENVVWLKARKSLCTFVFNSWAGVIAGSILVSLISSIFFFIVGVTGRLIYADAACIAFMVGGSTVMLFVATLIGVGTRPPRMIEHFAFHVRFPAP